MSADAYRTNLREAQRRLEITTSVKDEFKRQDLIVWGTTQKGFEGWLVKSKKADDAYSAWAMAKTDVEHWGGLLNDSIRLTSVPQDSRLPPEKDDEPALPANSPLPDNS